MEVKKTKTMFKPVTQVRPDSKGRITLSKLAEGVSSYNVSSDENGCILLEPLVEIPAREKWLFENPKAHASILRGLTDAGAGKLKSLGSFAQYINEDEET